MGTGQNENRTRFLTDQARLERLQWWGWSGSGLLVLLMVWLAFDFNIGEVQPLNLLPFLLGLGLFGFWVFRFGLARRTTSQLLLLAEAAVVIGVYWFWSTGEMEKLFFRPQLPALTRWVQANGKGVETPQLYVRHPWLVSRGIRALPNGERWIIFHEFHTVNDWDAALIYSPKTAPSQKTGLVEPIGQGWYRYFERNAPYKRRAESAVR